LTNAAVALAPASGMTAAACLALGISRATVQRKRGRLITPPRIASPRPAPPRALTSHQQQVVLNLLHEPRFADQAPAEVYATLLDEGTYHCSVRTMYRILERNSEVRERRAQLRHPAYQKPELLAENPNQVWSWDITKLAKREGWGQPNGATSTSTSSSTSSAAGWSDGAWRMPKVPRCSSRCSMTPSPRTGCHPANSRCMRI
jgi:putative transposase